VADKNKLFDDEFLKKLEYLYLVSKKTFTGNIRAETRSKKMGWGMEFADYRDYHPGDDLRYLDWNLYGRFGQLVTKLFHEEENLNVYFLLDCSRSMDYGHPTKFDYARKILAALAYVALSNLDTVNIFPFGNELLPPLPGVRGKGQILKIFEYLENQAPIETTAMEPAFQKFAAQAKSRGLVVVISDFFDEAGFEKPLKSLFYAKHDLSTICIHHEFEARPKFRGAVRFTDSETGRAQMVTISGRAFKKYEKEYAAFCDQLQQTSNDLQCTHLRTLTSVPFEDLILNVFRAGRFVK
jgi:uncharacterized protein (DUF58 family)